VKKMSLPVAVFVAILGCVLAVSANVTTMQIHDQLKKERLRRFQAENTMQKMAQELKIIKSQANQYNQDLASIQEILGKRDTEKNAMKKQLDSLNEQNQVLLDQLDNLKKLRDPKAPEPKEPAAN